MKQTTNKREIIKRLNQAFKNGDLELLDTQDTNSLLKLLNALDAMRYKDIKRTSEVLGSIVGVDAD